MNNLNRENVINSAQKEKYISGSTLKIIAIIAMLIDHTAFVLLNENYYLNLTMRLIGRIAFPLFVFLMIEGAIHTRSKLNYALRLSLFAILSEIPFDLAFQKCPFYFGYQNVFFTLAIGMFMIICFDLISTNKINKNLLKIFSSLGCLSPTFFIIWLYGDVLIIQTRLLFKKPDLNSSIIYFFIIALFFLLTFLFLISRNKIGGLFAVQKASSNLFILFASLSIAFLLKTDYSVMGILTIAIMYILRTLKIQSFLIGCLILIFFQFFEISSLLGLIPISRYNGSRGLNLKYVFYIFYPAHLLLLYFISILVGTI